MAKGCAMTVDYEYKTKIATVFQFAPLIAPHLQNRGLIHSGIRPQSIPNLGLAVRGP